MSERILSPGILSVIASFTMAGCQSTAPKNGPGGLSATSSAFPPILCSQGDATSFSLVKPEFTPHRSSLHYPGPHVHYEFKEVNATQGYIVRLDTCVNDTEVNLKRVIIAMGPFTIPNVFEEFDEVKGLSKAIFEADHRELSIIGKNGEGKFLARGWRQGTRSFATMSEAAMNHGQLVPTSLDLITGVVQVGDPIVDQNCAAGQIYQETPFQLGSARFSAKLCTYLGGGQTTAYDVVGLTIVDTNAALAPDERGEHSFDSKTAVDAVMKYKYNHHNGCDSFYIKLPAVEYAATSAPLGGCGTPVENAPARSFDDPNSSKTLFRVRYHDGNWQEGIANCSHYMLNCTPPSPHPGGQGFEFKYSNHQWNTVDFKVDSFKVSFDTPQGDGANNNRNLGPGFRPRIPYNRMTYLAPGHPSLAIAVWRDQFPANDTSNKSLCRRVTEISDAFPRHGADFLASFGLAAGLSVHDCGGFAIPEPDTRPGFGGQIGHTGDFFCVTSPRTTLSDSSAPALVWVWVPMYYSAQPLGPFLNEWPKDKAKLCIDGQLFEANRLTPPG